MRSGEPIPPVRAWVCGKTEVGQRPVGPPTACDADIELGRVSGLWILRRKEKKSGRSVSWNCRATKTEVPGVPRWRHWVPGSIGPPPARGVGETAQQLTSGTSQNLELEILDSWSSSQNPKQALVLAGEGLSVTWEAWETKMWLPLWFHTPNQKASDWLSFGLSLFLNQSTIAQGQGCGERKVKTSQLDPWGNLWAQIEWHKAFRSLPDTWQTFRILSLHDSVLQSVQGEAYYFPVCLLFCWPCATFHREERCTRNVLPAGILLFRWENWRYIVKGMILQYRSQASKDKVKQRGGVVYGKWKEIPKDESFIRKIIRKKKSIFEAGLESDFLFHFLSSLILVTKTDLFIKPLIALCTGLRI